jgi:hypothetical protein
LIPPLTTLYFTFIYAIYTTLLATSLHLTVYHFSNPPSEDMWFTGEVPNASAGHLTSECYLGGKELLTVLA